MSSDTLDQKHLNLEDRRRRFDPGCKWGGYGGRSMVKAQPRDSWLSSHAAHTDIYLKIQRPTGEDGHVLVSELDKEMETLLCHDAEGNLASEVSGGHWFRLPALLDAQCVSKTTKRDKEFPAVIITTYSVPGTSWMVPNEAERRRLDQRRQARLSLACPGGRKVFCKFRDTPLEKIPDKTLLDSRARLSASALGACNVQSAKVLQESYLSCWVAAADASRAASDAYLEVDLGGTCKVTYVSTQGRFPPISHTDKETQMRVVDQTRPTFMNWVTSYELSCRATSGHDWIVLGELKGNDDMTTEVAHELAMVTSSKVAVECRYLRFRPLTYSGLPVMRVGVYGQRSEGPSTGVDTAKEDEHLIRYSIYCIKEEANTRQAPVGWARCRLGCAKCKRTGPCKAFRLRRPGVQRRMLRLRSGVVEEIQRLNLDTSADDVMACAAANEPLAPEADEPPDVADEPGDEVHPPPPPRALARTRSFSDPQLSVTASSSADGSFVCVDDPESFAALDSEDWVVV